MFKSWSKKNKIKAVFKLQFQATQVPKMKKSKLMIALVPEDVGKPTVKLEKVAIQDGTCSWENPIFEAVKLVRNAKSGKLHEKIYHFVVSTGSSKSGFLGEASVDFADFVAENEPLTVSLPLKFANSGSILHVTIQNVEGYTDQRNGEDNGDACLKHQLSCYGTDERYNVEDGNLIKTRSGYTAVCIQNVIIKASNGVTPLVTSWQDCSKLLPPLRQNSMPAKGNVEAIATKIHMRRRSNTDWLLGSASDGSLGDWTNSLEDNLPKERLQEPSDSTTENLKNEIASLKRHAEVSALELQSLQKLLEKECSRAQDMSRQIFSLRDERDMLKTKLEQVKSQQSFNDETKTSKTLQSEIEDTRLQLETIKEQLAYEKEFSANLQLRLQKTQNSNSELLLAVSELEAMLEQKNKEILDNTKKHDNARELDLLKQKIAEQDSEMDIYHKQREQLNDHINELTMEYELLKKENLDISLRLKQGEAQEIMLQNEHSASLATIEQFESQVQRLEEKTKKQTDEFSKSLLCINELENQVNDLERELKAQAEEFQDDLYAMKCGKIEQEERASQAEETLRKTRHENTLTSGHLQDEYRRLSVEMALKVEENERTTVKAKAEADELRKQNELLEETIQKCNQELRLMPNRNEVKLQELLKQTDSKGKTIEMMSQELESKSKKLEDGQRYSNEKEEAFSKQIQLLSIEIKKLMTEDYALSEAKPTEQMTNMITQEKKDEKMLLGTLLSDIETFKIQHSELKHSLYDEQVEKENMKKHISKLEGVLMQKEADLSVMENKLKNNRGQAAATHMNLASRDNECAGPRSATKEHFEKSKSDMHKGIDAANTAVGKSGKGGTTGRSAENNVCLVPHISEVKTCTANEAIVFNDDHDDGCHTNELLNEVAILKERNKYMESELKEMQERYSEISLKFAEVEGERQQLVMALRNLKNGKN